MGRSLEANLGLMGNSKTSSELLKPLDEWGVAWTNGANLGLTGNLKTSSELLKPLDEWGVAWTNGANLGLMGNIKRTEGHRKELKKETGPFGLE